MELDWSGLDSTERSEVPSKRSGARLDSIGLEWTRSNKVELNRSGVERDWIEVDSIARSGARSEWRGTRSE
eukprot:2602621-Pleurochrysis_carterae.AAC.1